MKLAVLWNSARSQLWFIPGLLVALALGLAWFLPWLDTRWDLPRSTWWFSGDAGAARLVLSTIAGSLITVVSLAFSVTILVLQQASTQYSPRVVVHFLRYWGSQVVLGAFIGTFLYSLLVLRRVRGDENGAGEFIPEIATTASIVFATVCAGLLAFLLHQTSMSLQVAVVTKRIRQDAERALDRVYPGGDQREVEYVSYDMFRERTAFGHVTPIRAETSGYLTWVDEPKFTKHSDGVDWVAVLPCGGAFCARGDVIIELGGSRPNETEIEGLRSSVKISTERSLDADPLFGVRQLVDIGLRALSPGINDPTTAQYAVDQLQILLITSAERPMGPQLRVVGRPGRKPTQLWLNHPTFKEFVELAYDQIRSAAAPHPAVLSTLLEGLERLGGSCRNEEQLNVLRTQLAAVEAELDQGELVMLDRRRVSEKLEHVRWRLATGSVRRHDRED
jgi:uncharacterized membrane protein